MVVQLVRPEFDAVVTSLYEAAAMADLWPQALEALARLTGSRGALVTSPDHAHSGLMYSPGLKDTVAQFFEQGWHRNDLRSDRLTLRGDVGFRRDQDITSGEERAGSDYYNGFARPAGVPWFAACGTTEADGSSLGISIQRSASDGEFGDADLENLMRIEHHAKAALSFSRRVVAAQVAERLTGLGRLNVAAALLGADGRVSAVNAQAEQLFRDGTLVRVRGGRVTALALTRRRPLERLVSRACATERTTDAGGLAAVRLDGQDGAVLVQAMPLVGAAHELIGTGRAILTFTPIGGFGLEPAAGAHDAERLAVAFGLTATEARIAQLLTHGLEPSAIAQALGVSQGAVRFHLKSILPKAGVSRQAAFVALAASVGRPH